MALKKKFMDISLPLTGDSFTALGTIESLVGKTIKLDLTRKLRGKGLEITFLIVEKDGKLIGLPKSFILIKSYIRRIMRTGTSYVEDSFKAQSKDGEVTMKPFLLTRKKVSRAVRNHLRQVAREQLLEIAKDKTFSELTEEVYSGNLQKSLIPKLKKVYPLAFCDLRVFETNKPILDENIKIPEKKKEVEEYIEEDEEEKPKKQKKKE